MKMPESRADFDDYFIVCEDVTSYDLAFKDCSFDDTMNIMLKLNNNRNNEFRMELCYDNPCMPEDKCIPLFCIGVLVMDGVTSGYVDIHYSEHKKKEYTIELSQVEQKNYEDYKFYSDTELAIKGIKVINKYFDMQLMPAVEE